MNASLARWFRPALGVAVSLFFLGLLWRQIDVAEVGATLSHLAPSSLVLAMVFLGVDYTARIIRWWWMLRAFEPQLPLAACGWPFLVSISLNNLLPFRAGDATRVFGFRKALGLSAMRLLGTLVVERLLDLMTLLAIFFGGLYGIHTGAIPAAFTRLALWISAAGVSTVLAILLFSNTVERLVRWVAGQPAVIRRGWSRHLTEHSGHFLEALGLLRAPRVTLQCVTLSLVAWGFEGAVFATIAHALRIQTAAGAWFALATGTLGTLLPSSPGYVGTFDYLAMLGLAAYGTAHEPAAAFAFTVHLVLWLPLTLTGLLYFILPSTRAHRGRTSAAAATNRSPR